MADPSLLRTCGLFAAALLGQAGLLAGVPVAAPLDTLLAHIFDKQDAKRREKVREFCHSLAEELAVLAHSHGDRLEAACLVVDRTTLQFGLTHLRLVQLNLDPRAATDELAGHLAFGTSGDRAELEQLCRHLIQLFYEKLPHHAEILREMLPDLWAVMLERQAAHRRQLDRIEEVIQAGQQDTAANQQTLLTQYERIIALLEQEKGIPHAALLAHLVRLGADPQIAPAQVPGFLERFAAEYVELREQWARRSNAGPGIAMAREEALALLDSGDLAGARRLLREARERIGEDRRQRAREEATLLADEARVDRLELRYRDAAALFAEAAALVAFDAEAGWRHRLAQADALYAQGYEFGDNAALAEAIEVYRTALALAPRLKRPADWAMTQNDLGNALATLGEREDGTARLEEAVATFLLLLEEWTRELEPLRWAMTQNNLGNALRRLGEHEGRMARLEEAVLAYRLALEEFTREQMPLQWAQTMENVAIALMEIGRRAGDAQLLSQALEAADSVLEEYRAAGVAFYIEKAERLRVAIVAALGGEG